MRIVIDLQGAQSTGSRNRGIGRYALSLAQGVARNRGNHEVMLALSGAFPEAVDSIREIFQDLIPQENIVVWHIPEAVSHIDVGNTWRRHAAERIRESFLASLNPDVVLVSSLFEGFEDDSVTSVGCFADNLPTAVVLYDLIPYINRDTYLKNPLIEKWYDSKINYLQSAGLLLSISESSRQEAIQYLGVNARNAVNISTAVDAHFKVRSYSDSQKADVLARFGLNRAFVMYTGGIDHRKNIEGLIRSYARLPAVTLEQHQLAVVCSVRPEDRARLEALAKEHGLDRDQFVMTGFVSEGDLVALYNLCQAFIFPSWHEGFGLPALEAMSCGRAVVAANTSSLPEVVNNAQAMFDPLDDASITEKLREVLMDDSFRAQLERHGLEQAKEFSWDKTAQRAIAALETFHEQCSKETPVVEPRKGLPRLAYVSPLPPERSGISDYSAELLPELLQHFDIDVVVTQSDIEPAWIKEKCPVRTVEWFVENAASYDHVLYHFGNSTFHEHMFELVASIPGVVVLHDFFLSGILAHMELNTHAQGIWTDALYESHGYAAVIDRFHSKELVDAIWKYPANLPVLKSAQGVIIHSENSRKLANQWYGPRVGSEWVNIPLLRVPAQPSPEARGETRNKLGLKAEDFVVCSFGLLGPSKLNHRLLEAWLSSPMANDATCILVFVGQNDPGTYGDELQQRIDRAGVASRILITGWASSETFRDYLAVADVGVQLRAHSRGETSAAVLDCMNYGLATIVNANGSMADLEDDGVVKLPDEFADGELIAALSKLWTDAQGRHALGARAQSIVHSSHAPAPCATQYKTAIEHFRANSKSGVADLIQSIALLEAPPESPVTDEDFMAVAEAVDRSLPAPLERPQLLLDITPFIDGQMARDSAKSLITTWLARVPAGVRFEPVYASCEDQVYRYAREFTLSLLGCPTHALHDEKVTYRMGDQLVMLEAGSAHRQSMQEGFQALVRQGVKSFTVAGNEDNGGLDRIFAELPAVTNSN
ncbi:MULTISPECIES: glycosyltransferase [Pseudomonas]|jgi:glycosyltransferase involved in cell wall biosynthesis|uniref:glycosyltransferase n=1 Tax=Pseudomonas TaxID=286 RepID=UPI001D36AD7B|nr:glycosyltransferase [Pseudomonas sp. Bi123]CAH0263834.1 D-inositol 3-phosphate glycosyltransferase [Pseudomonas sp. Bi123]